MCLWTWVGTVLKWVRMSRDSNQAFNCMDCILIVLWTVSSLSATVWIPSPPAGIAIPFLWFLRSCFNGKAVLGKNFYFSDLLMQFTSRKERKSQMRLISSSQTTSKCPVDHNLGNVEIYMCRPDSKCVFNRKGIWASQPDNQKYSDSKFLIVLPWKWVTWSDSVKWLMEETNNLKPRNVGHHKAVLQQIPQVILSWGVCALDSYTGKKQWL